MPLLQRALGWHELPALDSLEALSAADLHGRQR